MATRSIRLSVTDNDSYDSSVRFDDENLSTEQKGQISAAISDMTDAFDVIRNIVI